MAQRPDRTLGGLRSGDRVPNLAVERDGKSGRLHPLQGGRWAVVSGDHQDTDGIAAEVRRRVGDNSTVLLQTTAAPAQPVLVIRPDGHLGWHGTKIAGLRAWFEHAHITTSTTR